MAMFYRYGNVLPARNGGLMRLGQVGICKLSRRQPAGRGGNSGVPPSAAIADPAISQNFVAVAFVIVAELRPTARAYGEFHGRIVLIDISANRAVFSHRRLLNCASK